MKKVILYGAAALMLTATACSNDETVEVPQGAAIGFKTMIDKNAGRATELTVANLTQFKVWGTAAGSLIFDAQVVNANNGVCTYSPVQYWEANKAYAFTAVGSNETPCTATTADKGATFAFDNKTANGNEDLVFATQTRAAYADLSSTIEPVDLAFSHALSRVKFTFVNGMKSEAYTLKITDVQIDNAAATGVLTIADGTWTKSGEAVYVYENIASAIANTMSGVTGYQYIIPGTQALTVSFNVVSIVNGVETKYNHQNVAITLPNDAAYANGSSYNFTATITPKNIDPENELKPIVFEASVNAWGADNEGVVTVK